MTTAVRRPAVAGTFYPASRAALERAIDAAFAARADVDVDLDVQARPRPKAIIAPHAGYVYSGPVAASAYATLAAARGTVERVVLLGPSHFVSFEGLAVSGADVFETPLGPVRVDTAARDAVLADPHVSVRDDAHRQEHSLEVHLPFIQTTLGDVAVLPIAVGHASADVVAAVLDRVWGGPETLVVVSTDLSHYHDHATAVRLDAATAEAITAKRASEIGDRDACGAYPVRGLLLAAARRGLDVTLLDLRTSGDTAGPRDRVVGYGAFLVA